MPHKILITGCGRSGTEYISKLLGLAKLDLPHEKMGTNGTVDWHEAVTEQKFDLIFHQVRDPILTISSLRTLSQASWKYASTHFAALQKGEIISRCIQYWYFWNLAAEKRAEWTYCIEDIDTVFPEMCQRLGIEADPIILTQVPRNVNTRRRKGTYHNIYYRLISWTDIKDFDQGWHDRIRDLAQHYGYTYPEE